MLCLRVCRGDARRDLLCRVFAAESHSDVCTGHYFSCVMTNYGKNVLSLENVGLHLFLFQDENMISFIKGGIKIRTSYQIYK